MKFSDISFKNKIFLLLALPLIGFVWLSISTIKDNYSVNNEMNALSQLTRLSITYSELVHELQKERGATAGFLGSAGKNFISELNKQHIATDLKKHSGRDFLAMNSFKQPQIIKLNQDVVTELEKLQVIRSQVKRLEINITKAIEYYTNLNAKLLAVSTLIADLSTRCQLNKANYCLL